MVSGFVTRKDKVAYEKAQAKREEWTRQRQADEIERFLNSIPEVVKLVAERTRDYYINNGHYPRDVNLSEHLVTKAVAASTECKNALYEALTAEDDHVVELALRVPSKSSGSKSQKEAWYDGVTVVVTFTP